MIFPTQFPYCVEKQVKVSIPDFPVTLNDILFDNNDIIRYPLLVYKDITYFPMTYNMLIFMNLNVSWTESGTLVIKTGNIDTAKAFSDDSEFVKTNKRTQTAFILNSILDVNGKTIDNNNQQYPLLLFRDITYFPLTWNFAVNEFRWYYSFNNLTGLIVSAYSFYYYNSYSTTYKNGDLKVLLRLETDRLGPIKNNLRIINNGIEKNPEGYFGYYYHGNGPLFTIRGDYIYTTQVITPNHSDYFLMGENIEARTPYPCTVNIYDCQILNSNPETVYSS